jgi:hypothetical protein
MQINSTEAAGFLAFLPAALACAATFWARRRNHRRETRWAVLSLIYTLLSAEILLSLRHRVDQAIGDTLRAAHLYPERRPAQAAAVIVVVILSLLVTRVNVRSAPTSRLSIASGATAPLLSLFVVESISLHAIDAILYRPIGPIMLIGWLWLACGWTTLVAAGTAAAQRGERKASKDE